VYIYISVELKVRIKVSVSSRCTTVATGPICLHYFKRRILVLCLFFICYAEHDAAANHVVIGVESTADDKTVSLAENLSEKFSTSVWAKE